jgi:diacylglycerol O-acyltransferase / wax synthase
MTTTQQRMLHSDAFAWYMEKDPVLRSTVVAILRLDNSPDWDLLRSRIDRLTRLVPKLRMRVQAPPLRIGPPRWTIDESFDLDFHLRRAQISSPGGWPEVLEFGRIAAMDDFDRSRPLWEFTLLEGLADGGGAFVTKLHHSLTDGIGGVQLAALVVDEGPEPAQLDPMPPEPHGHGMSPVGLTTRSAADDAVEAAAAAARILRALPAGVVHAARHPVSAAQDAIATTRSIGRFVAPVNRQFSTVLGERRMTRRLATSDVPLGELHAAATNAGGHLNDAYLAALTGAVQRYHQRRGAGLSDLRVTVPVSIRTGDDPIGGNRITLVRITLPATIDDPADRIRRIAAIMQRWRHEPALGHTQEIAFGLNLLPRPYLGGIFKRIEVLASDVPGVPRPVWLAGARVTGYYGFGPTIGSGLNATLMSYADVCNIGINIDTSAIDDPDTLLECLREAFDEVLALGAP